MFGFNKFIPAFAMLLLTVTAPLRAEDGSAVLEARLHASLNTVVTEVREAKTPTEKREILRHFLTKMEAGLENAKGMAILDYKDREALQALQKKFYAYEAELNGEKGLEQVADVKLDAFAGYIQQDLEQADLGGGIYISGFAIIIILLILIFLL